MLFVTAVMCERIACGTCGRMRVSPQPLFERKDLAGIQRAGGIHGIVDAAHEGEVRVGEEQRHEFALFHADPVLAGEAAADFDAITDDFGGGFEGAFELFGVARIVENDGVKIAVAGMEDVADVKAELLADFLNAAKSLRKFRAGDDAVEYVDAGGDAAERAESVLAAFPEQIALVVIAGDADFASVMRAAHFVDGRGLRGDSFRACLRLR